MEVKGVVPKQLPDGTVQLTLSKTRDAIRCQTLENMWKNLESAGKQPCTPEDAAVPKASEEATQIPAEHAWRCKVRSAVRETMAEILLSGRRTLENRWKKCFRSMASWQPWIIGC